MKLMFKTTTKLAIIFFLLNIVIVVFSYQYLTETQFIITEIVCLIVMFYTIRLIIRLHKSNNFLKETQTLIQQQEFTSQFKAQGIPELDELISVYNQLQSQLHVEKLELGELNGFYQQLIHIIPQAIITLDFDGIISQCNPLAKEWLGWSGGQNKSIVDINTPLSNQLITLAPGEQQVWNNNQGARFLLRCGEFYDRGFKRNYYVVENVTQELDRSAKQTYDQLVRIISHEVNNNLTGVQTLLTALKPTLTPKQQNALSIIEVQTSRMNAFVKRLADLVRMPTPTLSSYELSKLVKSVTQFHATKAKRENINIATSLDENIFVTCDPVLINQALSNVLKNAVEAVSEIGSGDICIRNEIEDNQVKLFICDSANLLPQQGLFTPFFTTKPSGQGLGLQVIKDIFDKHGFEFGLMSKNNRTVFHCTIPINSDT